MPENPPTLSRRHPDDPPTTGQTLPQWASPSPVPTTDSSLVRGHCSRAGRRLLIPNVIPSEHNHVAHLLQIRERLQSPSCSPAATEEDMEEEEEEGAEEERLETPIGGRGGSLRTKLGGSTGEEGLQGCEPEGSNNDIPAPNNTLPTIVTKFKRQGLDLVDVVALSGSHTIGLSHCTSFRQRLYNQTGNGLADGTLEESFAAQLRRRCPRSGGDGSLFPLDLATPTSFDNLYFRNIVAGKGLLSSDQVLFTESAATVELVRLYAENNALFLEQFARSMVKLGNISPLTGSRGEIRKNCRRLN